MRAQAEIDSRIHCRTSFARGDAHVASELSYASARLIVEVGGRQAEASTDQLHEDGMRELVSEALAMTRQQRTTQELELLPSQVYPKGAQIFFDSTVDAMAGQVQAEVLRRVMDAAEAVDLLAASDLSVSAFSRAALNTEGLWAYERSTWGWFSMTARTRDGSGSGWAWGGYEDWDRVDIDETISRAVTLGQRSANPVAVEPGRYTVILEPAAVAELVETINGVPTSSLSAATADRGASVFSHEPPRTNKIGLQMMDRRLGMISDPWDPENPGSTMTGNWVPIPEAVPWFEQGVLKHLAYSAAYARQQGVEPVVHPGGVRLTGEGPPQTLDEMIASTQRGLWVNRLSHVVPLDTRTLLLTGMTRDGTFLIENGKITKPIKNFRFTESPFFVFNRVEAWSEPVRASYSVVAPRLKVRDFNFTSLSDAV